MPRWTSGKSRGPRGSLMLLEFERRRTGWPSWCLRNQDVLSLNYPTAVMGALLVSALKLSSGSWRFGCPMQLGVSALPDRPPWPSYKAPLLPPRVSSSDLLGFSSGKLDRMFVDVKRRLGNGGTRACPKPGGWLGRSGPPLVSTSRRQAKTGPVHLVSQR